MFKKIILLLLISSVAISGFAQKNKRNKTEKSPKGSYFEILVNGKNTPDELYCPLDTLVFTFTPKDTNIVNYTFRWYNAFANNFYNTDTIRLAFPRLDPYDSKPNIYKIYLYTEIHGLKPFIDTIFSVIDSVLVNIDFYRTVLDTAVCQGRSITVSTITQGDITFTNVQSEKNTPWDTLPSVSGCDSLICWHIQMDSYITMDYAISSCDSVIWGDVIVRRAHNYEGDYETSVERVFLAKNPKDGCDTLKKLTVTIIDINQADTVRLNIEFNQKKFCEGDMGDEDLKLKTNFTAFDWIYKDKDSTFTVYDKNVVIEDRTGDYFVTAYMDTRLYDTLTDLRIVNCSLTDHKLVEDCPLVIPNVITPNDDNANDILGIKKLNPKRENELTIYDRWGKVVFSQKNYQCLYHSSKGYLNVENAFDGKSRSGQELPDGTYYYAFKYNGNTKALKKTYSGIIMIMR